MSTTVSFYTIGCRLNQAETAILQQAFEQEGFQYTRFGNPSDLVVVNTCTVTEHGDAGTRKIVNKILRVNPNAKIALIGCQAQTQKEKLMELPGVQWVIGNAVKMDLPAILKENLNHPLLLAPRIPRENFTIPVAGIDRKHTRANLKIQDGCDFFCSFCEIPYARGRARSREFDDILIEARILVNAGHREVVLTGINIGTYNDKGRKLIDVINALEQIPELLRIRITSVEATTFPVELLVNMDENHKLCRFLHISLQSGSNRILQLMNRKYTTEEFAEFLLHAYHTVNDICLGTDVIVGFPGETDSDFEETFEFMKSMPFTYFHVFSYSDRDFNKSRKFPDKVPVEIIKKRNSILRELSRQKRVKYLQGHVGKTAYVLFEHEKKGYWNGVTDTYIRVNVKSDSDLHNRFLPVRIESVNDQEVIGKLV
ncbi:tRNA (N(6)-L-threonylcarbamoyladenosine(37)-C(2))-methylthiotransferase MtaB [candidate division KSB1 bacterium]|nr:tRNA (N(6)-L-threonylcarbamoyladenosine(37)-C(2))-methylthiotransferase MtaB [candidate division KSB1 bacterium]